MTAATGLTAQVEADARANMGELVMQTTIPRNVRISEAPSHALPVLQYDPSSRGAARLTARLAKEDSGAAENSNSVSEA